MSLLPEGLRVVQVGCNEVVQIAGRLFADLGADVVQVVDPASDGPPVESPGESSSYTEVRDWIWAAQKRVLAHVIDDSLHPLLERADIVLASSEDLPDALRRVAESTVLVVVSPFGETGPRASWRGSDLTCLAAGGSMYATGDADRRPLRCWAPVSYAHAAAEAVTGALSAHRSAPAGFVSVSVQEAAQFVNIFEANSFPYTGDVGHRAGAKVGKIGDIWECRDGYVIFGLRGGNSRVKSMNALIELMRADGIDVTALERCDWANLTYVDVTDELVAEIVPPTVEFFRRHTKADLYRAALETDLMLGPLNGAADALASAQLSARAFFEDHDGVPLASTLIYDGAAHVRPPVRFGPVLADDVPEWNGESRRRASSRDHASRLPWKGLRILELGSAIAGPAISRYFVELGAECIKLESRAHVDIFRTVSGHHPADPNAPRFEGSRLWAQLNVGKLGVTINLRTEPGLDLVRRLVSECDVVTENFSPGTLAKFGLDYASLAAENGRLVMVSSCLYGNSGPEHQYSGYGSQAAGISGYSFLTGWPDRPPVGIYPGAITDSLGPAFSAAVLAAAIMRSEETGKGMYLDLAQAEVALYSLSPWLAMRSITGTEISRMGSDLREAMLHDVFPCRGEDRWVAIALWDADDWRRFEVATGVTLGEPPSTPRASELGTDVTDEVRAWTMSRNAVDVASSLQASGIEAYPVNDFRDLHADPQLSARGHFVELEHPHLQSICAQRPSYRIAGIEPEYRIGPSLGEHTEEVLTGLLGLTGAEFARLSEEKVLW